jgi:hypothetical protein
MIDWKHVSALREEIGAADFEEVVPMLWKRWRQSRNN